MDDFFSLGGTSLLAMRMVNRLQATLQLELRFEAFLDRPTARGLALVIEDTLEARCRGESNGGSPEATSGLAPLDNASRDRRIPLSFVQQRMWMVAQLADADAYNVPAALRMAGRVEPALLRRSLNEIVRRHEILRTRFVLGEDEPYQQILPRLELDLPVADLSALPPERRATEARRLAERSAHEPFDLAQGSLLRVRLLRLGNQEHVGLLLFHHIVCDGRSRQLFLEELRRVYRELQTQGRTTLPALPLQFADFAAWEQEMLDSGTFRPMVDFWKRTLAGARPVQLPGVRPRPGEVESDSPRQVVLLEDDLTEALRNLSRRYGVTLFMTLLAAFQKVLGWRSDELDVLVSTVFSGRTRPQLDNLIGPFAGYLLLRTRLSPRDTIGQLLASVRRTVIDAFAHASIPLERLRVELDGHAEKHFTQPYGFYFDLLSGMDLDLPGIRVEPFGESPAEVTGGELLNLTVVEEGRRLRLFFDYNPSSFFGWQVRDLAQDYRRVLEYFAEQPELTLAQLGQELRRASEDRLQASQQDALSRSLGRLQALRKRSARRRVAG